MRRAPLAAACALDLLVGDPPGWPHPVRAFGALIAAADARRDRAAPLRAQLAQGALLAAALVALAYAAGALAERRCRPLAVLLGASALAARSLDDAVGAVQRALERGDLGAARAALRHLVGRDVDRLDAAGIAAAALESLAESFCDGVVAPLLWLRAGGAGAALAFKAVSTLDSMIGHREPPHTFFGRFAARADDVANFVPARVAAAAIVVAAAGGGADARAALAVACADAPRHASPNAGWPEAALAGALRVRLGGLASYDGVPVARAVLGAAFAPPRARDLARGRRLVRRAAAVAGGLALASAR